MRALIAAIRAVKLYPSNNPIYSQSVKKSHELLTPFFSTATDLHVSIHKAFFSCMNVPVGKETQLNKTIAHDLFMKGVREIVITPGVTEAELLVLYQALAQSSESLAMNNGVASILWEKDIKHIKAIEAGLDEVITTDSPGSRGSKIAAGTAEGENKAALKEKYRDAASRTLVLTDLSADPEAFGAKMLELALQTLGEDESIEDRLYTLYQEAGRKIESEHAGESDVMFEKLAKSILSLDPVYRQGLVAGKLYADLDEEMATAEAGLDTELPGAFHEIQTGRFSDTWTVQQVATLLKKSASKASVVTAPPTSPADVEAVPLTADIADTVKQLSEYTPEEMESLKELGEAGMESDTIEAAMRTLIFLIPRVKNSSRAGSLEQELNLFSSVVRQLEDILSYLLKNKEYKQASVIIQAFHLPVDPAFKPRMMEAQRKTASRTVILAAIEDLQKFPKESSEYAVTYGYLSTLEQESTEALLELLADETDRAKRIYYLDLVKVLGKNQIHLLGERLSDKRWYFVRNIVNILAENKSDQALNLLRKAADHENIRIRQEVIKGLMSIGGKKAASILAKFLRDKDEDILTAAIHAFADFPGIGIDESDPLVTFLEERQLNKKELAITVEAIRSLGKIGGKGAIDFLQSYMRIKWWKSRKLQTARRDAAVQAVESISWRLNDGQRAKR